MKRRIASDEFVSQLEKAITAVDPAEWSTHRQRTMQGDPEEIATLTTWIEARRQEVAQHSDARTAMLFREQVKIAAEQRLPAPSSPHWRSAEQVVHETLLMTNADRIEEAERRLRSLWVSSSRPVYYRRGAYTVQNIDKMSQIALRQELLKNLAAVDDPGQLDELFFSYDHMLLRPNDEKGGETSFQLAGSASGADHGKTSSTVDDVIRAFLDEYAKRPGGLPIPVQSASAMLRAVTRPFLDGPGTVTGALLRRQVDLVVQSLASAGIRGRQLRDHERMIEAHLVSLHEKGLLPVPLPRRWRATGAAHRVAGFASTVPRWGLAALAGLCCVLALGFAIHGTEGRRFQSILVAARLFGFGSVLEDRPLLMFFAAIIVAYAVMHAVGHPSALTVLPRVGPLIALVLALALYARSVRGVGIALVAFLIFAVWGNVFFAMERLVATLVGAQATLVFAAASVITFAVLLVKEGGNPGVLGPLGIGIIAALWGGPSVPVTVGSTSFSGGRFRHSDDRARVRVPLDPALLSCVVAAALVALDFGVRGIGELISFAAIQAVVFALFARRRLRGDRVEKALAGLRVGTPLEHVELLRYLRRALLISVLVGVAVIGGCIAVALLSGVRTLSMVVLSELAGVLLVEGLLSLSSAMSVAGVGAPFLVESEADRGRNFLAERFRNWNQLRFAWAIKAGLIVLVLVKPLEWFSNWTGLADAAKSLWHLVTSLF
jgi:hypothetical protein